MRKIVFAALLCLTLGQSAKGDAIDNGMAICYEIENSVNALVDFTHTKCLPSNATGHAGALSFIVLSSEPVFSTESSKKAWLVVVAAALGKALNERPSIKADELWVSDANLMKRRIAQVFPATLTKSLQHQVYDGQIGLDEMYATIAKSLSERTIKNSK